MDDTKASEKSLQGSENGRASAASLEEPTSDGANENSKELSCFRFFSEWRHCTSAFHQFHQYYIHGEFNSCRMEKERIYNCLKWKTMGKSKEKAYNALLESLEAEQTNMRSPDVPWELRKEPPSDWNHQIGTNSKT